MKIISHLYIWQYFTTYKEKPSLKIMEKVIFIMEKVRIKHCFKNFIFLSLNQTLVYFKEQGHT